MLDKNVRMAAGMSIDKKARRPSAARLRRADRHAGDAGIRGLRSLDQGRATIRRRRRNCSRPSGYRTDNPVKFTIQTTRGFKPKDYEMIQAIVGMWRKVGIEADIEVYEIAKHYELRAADKLAPAAFYNWGNAIGDPTTSTGFAMFGPSPHSVWDSQDVDRRDQPAVGRGGRGQAHRRLEGGRQIHRRERLCPAADPVCAADRACQGRQGGAAQVAARCCRP